MKPFIGVSLILRHGAGYFLVNSVRSRRSDKLGEEDEPRNVGDDHHHHEGDDDPLPGGKFVWNYKNVYFTIYCCCLT